MQTCHRQPTKCKSDVDLLFAIKSVPKNGDRRDSLRNSWLDTSFYNGLKIKHVFLFGNKGNHFKIRAILTLFGLLRGLNRDTALMRRH